MQQWLWPKVGDWIQMEESKFLIKPVCSTKCLSSNYGVKNRQS